MKIQKYKFKNTWVLFEAFMTILLYSVALGILYQQLILNFWTSLGNKISICISLVAISLLHFRTIFQIMKTMSKYKSLEEIEMGFKK